MQRRDDDFASEIEAHIAIETDRLVSEGLTPEEARTTARRRFGNVTGSRERFHESRRVMWLEDARKDIGYALRTLARNPGFACVAVLTLALGTGATTAIFSVINSVLLQPLPFPNADRLVTIVENRPPSEPFDGRPARRPPLGEDIRALQKQTQTLTDLAVYGFAPAIRLPGREEEDGLQGARASGSLLRTLGARPVIGRLFAPNEEGAPVVVLSYEAWQRDFGADPDIVGRIVVIENGNVPALRTREAHTVIGVIAPGFFFPSEDIRYWMPTGGNANIARLKDGVSLDAAAAEVSTILHDLAGKPARAQGSGPPRFELLTIHDRLVAPVRPALRVLTAAVGVVLLIACANVANLLLSRAGARQREITVRTALGAGRGRLVRQMLTESTTLALLGGAAGSALAWGGLQLLKALFAGLAQRPGRFIRQIGVELGSGAPGTFPRVQEIALDATALLFTIVLCVVTGVLFGLVPALQQSGRDRLRGLREGSGTASGGLRLTRRNATRHLLVVAEIAMAMVLLAGGGLTIHSFARLMTVETGYESNDVLTFQVRRPASRSSGAELLQLSEDLVSALSSAPGIRAAAYGAQLPMVQSQIRFGFQIRPGEQIPEREPGPGAATAYYPDVRVVSPDYFNALGIRLTAGRGFTDSDGPQATPVLVINRELARIRFAGRNPIGTQLHGPGSRPWDIVGIVEDVRQEGADRTPEPQVFMNYRQWPLPGVLQVLPQYYAVRAVADPMALLPTIRHALRQRDPEATLENIGTMDELISGAMARPRTYAVLMGIFAGVAVALAAIGIYGVMAYAVAQSTREIGIRVALGAERSVVLGLVLRQGMALASIGIAIGLAGAAGLTRYLQGMLFGVTPLDARTFVVVALLFALIAALASYVPARRATRVDPLVALRFE